MQKMYLCSLCLFVLLSIFTKITFAWNHSIDFGYGLSQDPNHTKYTNSGFLLSGDIVPLRRTTWTFWSINGALGQWHSTAPNSRDVTSGAISLALRFYPFYINNCYPTYLFGSAGPAYISSRKLGTNIQASNLTIQTNLGLGAEFKKIDVNFRLAHFSNANLGKPNDGFNVLYLASIGYLF